jgi:hypothetical protein
VTRDGSVAALEGISFGIDEISRFDPEKIASEARASRAGG